jgi:hypothetical protein
MAIDVFLTTICKASFQPYIRLSTTSMAKNTLIKHKEVAIIYEENKLVIINYNALITHLESKSITQPLVTYDIAKQPLTCSNSGKIGHAKKTCHNMKKKLVAHVISTKFC